MKRIQILFTVETFIKEGQNTQDKSKKITETTGQVPEFYDRDTHIVITHGLDFNLLETINGLDFVIEVRGSAAPRGMASIGPVFDGH